MSDTNTNTAESQENTPTLSNFRFQRLVRLERDPNDIMDVFRAMNMGAALAPAEKSVEFFKSQPALMNGLDPDTNITFFERPYRTSGLSEECEPSLVYVGPEQEIEVLRHLCQDPMTSEEAHAAYETLRDILAVFDGYTQPEANEGESFEDYVDRTAYLGVGEHLNQLVEDQGDEAYPTDETIQSASSALTDYLNRVTLEAFQGANVPVHDPIDMDNMAPIDGEDEGEHIDSLVRF